MKKIEFNNENFEVKSSVNTNFQNFSKQEGLRIRFTTYALLIFIFLSNFNRFQFGVGFSGVIVPIAIFGFLFLIERRKFRFTKSHVYIFLFWIFAVISTLISDIVDVQRDSITFLLFTLFFIFSTAIKYNKRELRLIFTFYKLTAVLVSINIIYNYINNISYGWQRYSMSFMGVARDPNYASVFLPLAIILIVLQILYVKDISMKRKILSFISLAVITFAIFLTGSRATFLVLLLGVILVLFYYITQVRKLKMTFTLLVAVIMLTLGWSFIESQVPESTISRLTSFETYTGDVRVILTKQSMQLFYNSPILGAGINSTASYLFSIGYFHSHNMYVDILTSQGLIGLMLFALFVFRGILLPKRNRFNMFVFSILLFGPLFFINAFNTASFWLPVILYEILSSSLFRLEEGINDFL